MLAGYLIAIAYRASMDNLIMAVYIIFVVWGALGGLVFVYGAERRRSA